MEIFENYRVARIREERGPVLCARFRSLFYVLCPRYKSLRSCLPRLPEGSNLPDIAVFPEVRDIVDLPSEAEVTEKSFEPLVDMLPSLIARLQVNAKTQLERVLQREHSIYDIASQDTSAIDGAVKIEITGSDDEASLVDLAISVVRCPRCNEHLNFPALISHACNAMCEPPRPPRNDIYLWELYRLTGRPPWSVDLIFCDVQGEAGKQVRTLVDMCGLDWRTATWREMDQQGKIFVFVKEEFRPVKYKNRMNWRVVVSCSLIYHVRWSNMCSVAIFQSPQKKGFH